MNILRLSPALLSGLLVVAACSDNEAPPEESHTPATAALVVDGNPVDQGGQVILVAGTTVPIEVKFYHDDGDEITDIEDDHFAKLTFAPASLATSEDVPDQHFHKQVTAGAEIGTGSITVGYGHDEDADQLTFPFTVTVVVTAQ